MDLLFSERNKSRYHSNLIVNVQMNAWNPFVSKEARLIDFSYGGFKIEFLEDFPLKNMDTFFIIIPLTSFDIKTKKTLKLRAQIKWHDPLNKQVGGIYLIPKKPTEGILEKIILSLAQKAGTEQK